MSNEMTTIASVDDVRVGMSVRPKGGRYDWIVTDISAAGFVSFKRYSDAQGWLFGFKTSRAIAQGELRTYA